MTLPPLTTCREMIERYDTLLFDAYGVLISNHGALPHAHALITHLNHSRKPYFIVTNGSRNSPEDTAARYQSFGLPIPGAQVITSGSLVAPWIRKEGLGEARFMILGPPACQYMLADFPKATLVPHTALDFDVLIIGNQDGFPFRETMDHVISALFQAIDRGRLPHLVLPNPDLIYPDSENTYGITGGMIAHIIEAALAVRYPSERLRFMSLGKPYAPIFAEAKRRARTSSLVMVGDQMLTDIQGALDSQIDAVLVGTGLCRIDDPRTFDNLRPSFCLRDLSLA